MILDGVMVIIACISLTIMHPGIGFGKKWADSKFSFGRKGVAHVQEAETESPASKEKLDVSVSTRQRNETEVNE